MALLRLQECSIQPGIGPLSGGELAATIEEIVRAMRGEQLKDLSFIADQVHDLAGMCHRAVAQPTATGEGRAA